MAEMRCPMCGKPNSEEAEVCQFCQARLKPLQVTPDQPPNLSPGERPVPKQTDDLSDALPDWLKNIREDSDAQPEQKTPPESLVPGASEDLPDWLSDVSPTEENNSLQSDIPDWLSGLGEEETPQPAADADVEEPAPAEPAEQSPDWLSELSGQPQAAEEELPQVAQPATPAEGLPDWLSGLGEEETPQPAADAGVEEPAPAEPAEQSPDWLSELSGQPQAAEEEPSHLTQPATPAEDLPDWLSGLGEEETPQPAADADVEEPAPAEPAEQSPDWLSELSGQPQAAEEELPQVAQPATPAEDLPDWLSGLGEEETPQPAAEVKEPALDLFSAENPIEQPEPAQPASQTEEVAAPDWLNDLRGEEVELTLPDLQASDGVLASSEAFDVSQPMDTDQNVGDFEGMDVSDLPDWLSNELPEADEEQPSAETEDSGLAPSELPTWLQAMRPVASVTQEPSGEDLPVEEALEYGPFAGLRGILPAEVGITPSATSKIYSLKMQLTDKQQANVALLENMLLTEQNPLPLPQPSLMPAQRVLRWILVALLGLAVLLPLSTGRKQVPSPDLIPPETMAASQSIQNLPENAPVLLAFDYEPGLSGELDTAAEPVVDHLMTMGARMTIVSTLPTGPALAERLIAQTQTEHGYLPDQNYVNLGYIPGGPIGLLNFVHFPQRTKPFAISGVDAWGSQGGTVLPPLAGINQLKDFALVVVITENPNIARDWVEQVEPNLAKTPMVMVISAQAEPMVRPYYESAPQQIQGLITGLPGGASYARITGREGTARLYWDSLSYGVFMAEILILLAGIANIFLSLIHRRRQAKG